MSSNNGNGNGNGDRPKKVEEASEKPLEGGKINLDVAKRFMKRHDLQGVVILAIQKDGVIQTLTYGSDKRKCSVLGTWIQGFMSQLSIIPFSTVFGFGNGGKPMALSEDERAQAQLYKMPEDWYD